MPTSAELRFPGVETTVKSMVEPSGVAMAVRVRVVVARSFGPEAVPDGRGQQDCEEEGAERVHGGF